MTSRRTFITILPAAGALFTAGLARAQSKAMVSEQDPQALALGYVADASKADKAKYKQYAAGQHCGSCALFQGVASATDGACPIFAGKHVSAKGWCSAYSKKS